MRLLDPAWLWLLAGAVPVVLLYVLRARRRRVRVPSTLLWASAQRDLVARAPWRRLVAEASLALELLAVLALALAAASPTSHGRSARVEHIALVIDTSASMQAVEGASTRIDRARRTAQAAIDALPPDAEVMILEAGRDARIAVPMTRDRRALREGLRRVVARDVEGSLSPAIALATDRLRGLPGPRRVVVVTDGAVARSEDARLGSVPVQVRRVGAALENVAIVRLEARAARGSDGAEVAQVFALLAAFTEHPRVVELSVRREGDGALLGARRATLDPGERAPVVVTFPLAESDEGRGLIASVSPGDALAVDDVAYARVPPGATLPVVLAASEENPWLRRALTADPGVVLQEVAPENAADAPPGALVVFDGVCPDPLPDRDALIVAPPPGGCAGVTVREPVDAPAITSYATADPRFRFLTMDGVNLASATPLEPGPRAAEILRSSAGPLFVDASTPERMVTVLGLDVGRSDWPLRASFVVFVRNVVELSRVRRARAASGGGRSGEPLRVAVPARARNVSAVGPAGAIPVSVVGAMAVVGETSIQGLYRVRWAGGEVRVPVNLLSDAESNLRAPPWEAPATAPSDTLAGATPSTSLSPGFAAMASLALLADLWWLTRSSASHRPRRVAA